MLANEGGDVMMFSVFATIMLQGMLAVEENLELQCQTNPFLRAVKPILDEGMNQLGLVKIILIKAGKAKPIHGLVGE